MLLDVGVGNALHPVDFYLNVAAVGKRIRDLVNGLFVDLHAVDGEAGPSVEFLVADVTFKMLCFLMLNEYLLIVKLSVAIPE